MYGRLLSRWARIPVYATLRPSDGRLLILAGAAQEQTDLAYIVFVTSVSAPSELKPLAELKRIENGKAEAIRVLDSSTDALNVLVPFDGIIDDGARQYKLVP